MSNTTHSKVPTYLLGATVALSFIITIVGILTVSSSYRAIVKAVKANNQLGYYTAQLTQPITIAILTIGGIGLFVSVSALLLSLHRHPGKPAAVKSASEPTPTATIPAPAVAPEAEHATVVEPVPSPVAAAEVTPAETTGAKPEADGVEEAKDAETDK